jgi:two-component system phosphate regulon sensor histidine kinase PhoR
MSKKRLVTLIVSMALVLAGLIIVQVNSIQVASKIREEQFDQTVRHALSQVVRKMEEHERVLLLEEELSMANDQSSNSLTIPSFGKLIPWGLKDPNFSLSFSYSKSSQSIHQQMEFVFTDTIANLDQTTRGMPGDFPSAFDKLHDYNLQQQRLLQQRLNDNAQMLQKFFFRSRPIENRVNEEFLQATLKEEFRFQGINLDYEYAVKSFRGEVKISVLLKERKNIPCPSFPVIMNNNRITWLCFFPKDRVIC